MNSFHILSWKNVILCVILPQTLQSGWNIKGVVRFIYDEMWTSTLNKPALMCLGHIFSLSYLSETFPNF